MIPGPYSICRAVLRKNTDLVDMKTLRFGYDTIKQALAHCKEVAKEERVPLDEICIERAWTIEEAEAWEGD